MEPILTKLPANKTSRPDWAAFLLSGGEIHLTNPVSTTRRPSCRTRWHKTSFALARLRPSSDYADGFLPNPVSTIRRPSCRTRWKKTSFALARLRPSSDYADGLLTESRLANPTAIALNPMEENQSKIPKSPMYIYYI